MRRTLPVQAASGRQAACLLLRAVGCASHGALASSSAPVWLVLAGHRSQQQEFSLVLGAPTSAYAFGWHWLQGGQGERPFLRPVC